MSTHRLLIAVLVIIIISLILLIPWYIWRRVLATAEGQARPKFRHQVACLPLVIGMVVLCTLLSCIVPLSLISADQIANTERKPVIQAVTLDLVGQKVVAEGFISQENPIQAAGMVAYVRSTKATRGFRSRILGQTIPPLRVQLAGGEIWVENPASPADADYDLRNAWRDFGEPRTNTSGLVRDEQVTVIGTVESGAHGAYLDAEFISAGSRAEYLDTWAETRMPTPFIIGIGIIGLGICAYGLVPALRRD